MDQETKVICGLESQKNIPESLLLKLRIGHSKISRIVENKSKKLKFQRNEEILW